MTGKLLPALALLLAAVVLLISALLFREVQDAVDSTNRDADVIEREAERATIGGRDNRVLSCATARLVSYVPALQFEGEPLRNFIGWVESRRDMLIALRGREVCSARTRRLLEKRVVLDGQLLRQLRRRP